MNKIIVISVILIGIVIVTLGVLLSQTTNDNRLAKDSLFWEGKALDVAFDVQLDGDNASVEIKFLESGKDRPQVHVDYKVFITHEFEGLILQNEFLHSSSGIVTIPVDNVKKGVYVVTVNVTGIQFQQIESEKMFTHIIIE